MTTDSDIGLALLREQMTAAGPLGSPRMGDGVVKTTSVLRNAWIDEYGRENLPKLAYFATMARAMHEQFHITSKEN